MPKEQFSLDGHPFIELNNLIKVLGWCSSGGEAKTLITDGHVNVDGVMEQRKRCKIRTGQSVTLGGNSVTVTE